MMNTAKVMLSDIELAMAKDMQVILTKRAITETAAALFSSNISIITNAFKNTTKADKVLAASVPKIAKGENYNGFPYVLMDFPACFGADDIFTIRTMFWWGNFICITLHLKGKYKNLYESCILKNIKNCKEIYIGVGIDEWQHHFEENNFIKFTSITEDVIENFMKKNFMKIALKYELHQWNMMQSILPDGYKKIAELLKP